MERRWNAETSAMHSLSVRIASFLIIACWIAGCQEPGNPPPGFAPRTLDPKIDVEKADLIVLAYPVSHRDVGSQFSVRREGEGQVLPPLRIAETETTLAILAVFKGTRSLRELQFKHYRAARDYPIVMGPPQGPSGPVGERGIFFLKRQGSTLHSLVDVYRPDIPTPWITGSATLTPCEGASDCVARFLLSFHQSDKIAVFSAALLENAMLAQRMAGYITTFKLLSALADQDHPDEIKRQACVQLSKMYALEFPSVCIPVIAGTLSEAEYRARATRLRQTLKQQGLPWLRAQYAFRPNDDSTAIRDLQLMVSSADPATRAVAQDLLNSLKSEH